LPAPAYGPAAPAYGEPVYDGPAVYSFTYGVQDDYAGLNFGHSENREGYNTKVSFKTIWSLLLIKHVTIETIKKIHLHNRIATWPKTSHSGGIRT
jgi:hypothetical protein